LDIIYQIKPKHATILFTPFHGTKHTLNLARSHRAHDPPIFFFSPFSFWTHVVAAMARESFDSSSKVHLLAGAAGWQSD
jgi:hypothetical protein